MKAALGCSREPAHSRHRLHGAMAADCARRGTQPGASAAGSAAAGTGGSRDAVDAPEEEASLGKALLTFAGQREAKSMDKGKEKSMRLNLWPPVHC